MDILLRRRSSSSFTKAGRKPMAASCCAGSVAARSEAGSNNDSGVSCKQPGRGEKGVGGLVQVPYTRQPKRKRHDVAHDSTRLGLELQHWILRYAHRLRYHLAPDLRLTSRGASLAAKRHFYSPSKWAGFPCISRSSFTYFKGRRKFGPCGKSSVVPVLDLPRPRGLSKPYALCEFNLTEATVTM
jgi:hypothetical protein